MRVSIKNREPFPIFLVDVFSINIAWLVYYCVRIESRLVPVDVKPDLVLPMLIMYGYWLLLYTFFGLYRRWHSKSRVDEFIAVMKTTSIGIIILFFIFFYSELTSEGLSASRLLMAVYFALVLICVGSGRMILRSVMKRLLVSGVGVARTLILGWNTIGKELYDKLQQFPALGYHVVGFISIEPHPSEERYRGIPLIGSIMDLPSLIRRAEASEIIIALESTDHDLLVSIIDKCSGEPVNLKIIPDMYDIISGQARTNQIYGFPLIEIMPHIMQPWEESAKRLMDIIVSIVILTVSAPLWIVIAAAIKMNSPGPVVFSQERTGKDGKVFRMHKFRSMVRDAETKTGPVWAQQNDPRITSVGWFLRKTRLDEIPQFIDVLRGDMSLVGPRPERPYFVEKLSKEIPLYKRRLAVKPGITGWAQIKQGYDSSIDDVRSKVRYDLFYIENMSFRMDVKILLITVYTMIAGKGN